ncbi:MAG: C1 family peptidase, partial [bacterium]
RDCGWRGAHPSRVGILCSSGVGVGMPSLGRRYVPDPRDFPIERIHVDHAAVSLPPSVLWADKVVLDQGDFGTCIGNGWAGWGDSLPIADTYSEADARAIYYEATCIDGQCDTSYQNGSTVRSGAKAMQNRKRLASYAFLTTLDTIREWLANHGPIVFGSDWTNDMFTPDALGFVKPTGGVAGGHCFLCIGYDTSTDSFRFRNSWGSGWGLSGDFLLKSADVTTLLAGIDDPGEACAAAELLETPPTPAPPSPTPPAPPNPTPMPDFAERLLHAIEKALRDVFKEFFG